MLEKCDNFKYYQQFRFHCKIIKSFQSFYLFIERFDHLSNNGQTSIYQQLGRKLEPLPQAQGQHGNTSIYQAEGKKQVEASLHIYWFWTITEIHWHLLQIIYVSNAIYVSISSNSKIIPTNHSSQIYLPSSNIELISPFQLISPTTEQCTQSFAHSWTLYITFLGLRKAIQLQYFSEENCLKQILLGDCSLSTLQTFTFTFYLEAIQCNKRGNQSWLSRLMI